MTVDSQTPAIETLERPACRVSVDVFDGPLDLLLGLIKERRLDVATVPLAAVAEQYLAYVRAMQALDVELAADYLVIAATLVFLKSRALLPAIPLEFTENEDDTPEAVEERLRRRLIAYSQYRDLGERLRDRQAEAAGYFYRDAGDPAGALVQRYAVDPERLQRAFVAMLNQARPEKRSIARERLSLLASMDYVSRRLKELGEATFGQLCHELGMTREIVVVTFLALLELVRRRRIGFAQEQPFEDILLRWGTA
ncbi:MAG TPA: segregation/condensation protein A [Candidatus Tumulicola sp.]